MLSPLIVLFPARLRSQCRASVAGFVGVHRRVPFRIPIAINDRAGGSSHRPRCWNEATQPSNGRLQPDFDRNRDLAERSHPWRRARQNATTATIVSVPPRTRPRERWPGARPSSRYVRPRAGERRSIGLLDRDRTPEHERRGGARRTRHSGYWTPRRRPPGLSGTTGPGARSDSIATSCVRTSTTPLATPWRPSGVLAVSSTV